MTTHYKHIAQQDILTPDLVRQTLQAQQTRINDYETLISRYQDAIQGLNSQVHDLQTENQSLRSQNQLQVELARDKLNERSPLLARRERPLSSHLDIGSDSDEEIVIQPDQRPWLSRRNVMMMMVFFAGATLLIYNRRKLVQWLQSLHSSSSRELTRHAGSKALSLVNQVAQTGKDIGSNIVCMCRCVCRSAMSLLGNDSTQSSSSQTVMLDTDSTIIPLPATSRTSISRSISSIQRQRNSQGPWWLKAAALIPVAFTYLLIALARLLG